MRCSNTRSPASVSAAGRNPSLARRAAEPKRFAVRRIVGVGDLWVTEYVLTYDGRPSYTVSIMEFRDGQVARETQYFADPFDRAVARPVGRADIVSQRV